ncbi:hypothetical protein AMR41_09400 [Hapalosiphon sp. MRB220]|nr:hypothetical protein AMR41_09400 [Hapalosiphon sp. MRB220]
MDVVQAAGGSTETHAKVGGCGIREVQIGQHVADRAAALPQAHGDAVSAQPVGDQQDTGTIGGGAHRGARHLDAARRGRTGHVDIVGAERPSDDHTVGRRPGTSAESGATAKHAGQLSREVAEFVQADAQVATRPVAVAQPSARQGAGHRLVGVVQVETDAVRSGAAPGDIVELDDHALGRRKRATGIACTADLAGQVRRQPQPAIAHGVIGVVAVGDQTVTAREDAAVVVADVVVAREGPAWLSAVAEGRIDLELRTRRKREPRTQCRQQRNTNYL